MRGGRERRKLGLGPAEGSGKGKGQRRCGNVSREEVRTHRLELGLTAPARERLAEPECRAFDGFHGIAPRECLQMRREIGGARRNVEELAAADRTKALSNHYPRDGRRPIRKRGKHGGRKGG
jgi:hypothetical protein